MQFETKLAILNAVFYFLILFFKIALNKKEILEMYHKYDINLLIVGMLAPLLISLTMLMIVVSYPIVGAAIMFIALVLELYHDIMKDK